MVTCRTDLELGNITAMTMIISDDPTNGPTKEPTYRLILDDDDNTIVKGFGYYKPRAEGGEKVIGPSSVIMTMAHKTLLNKLAETPSDKKEFYVFLMRNPTAC